MKKQTERIVQTAIHSNPMKILAGSVTNSSGAVAIDFERRFISKPVFVCRYPVNSWTQDGDDYYTGCEVESDDVGDTCDWACVGVFIDEAL